MTLTATSTVTRHHVEVDGRPVRFYTNSRTKQRCVDHDKFVDDFPSEEAAHSKAEKWGLKEYKVVPFQRDLGTPVVLAELGF